MNGTIKMNAKHLAQGIQAKSLFGMWQPHSHLVCNTASLQQKCIHSW